MRQDSWAMFSPAELLKKYLGEAFNREGVPDAGNVRTWETERRDIARNVLNILRSTNAGRFQLEPSPGVLIDGSSPGIAKLHDEFAAYVETNHLARCNDALAALLQVSNESVRREALRFRSTLGSDKQIGVQEVLRLFDGAEGLQAESKQLNELIATELKKITNLLLNKHRTLLEEMVTALPTIKAEEKTEEEEETEADDGAQESVSPTSAFAEAANILTTTLRNWARAVAAGRRTLAGQSGRALELIKAKLPPDRDFAQIGGNITMRAHLRTLIQAPRTFVLGVPGAYARFRRQAVREGRHFAASAATTFFINRNRISPDELDVLMLVMLRHARRVVDYPDGSRLELTTPHDWLENIKNLYLMQVFVDEATDLSAVQLACTVELANPALRSWFACGDLRQRVTANGLQDDLEIEWLNCRFRPIADSHSGALRTAIR
jgi:hypothetical protein